MLIVVKITAWSQLIKNILINFEEKPQISDSNIANSAIYILSKDFIEATKAFKNKINFSTDIPNLTEKVYCFVSANENIDIGIKQNLYKINKSYSKN